MSSHRILVTDDDPAIRDVLTRFLTARGFEVLTAADGREALKILKSDPPDIVLLDIAMPRLNGIEVLRRMQADGIDVGVIMISGHPDEDAAKKSLQLGAADFIVKPFDFTYLETSLMAKLATIDEDEG